MQNESLLLEAIKNMLDDKALGLDIHNYEPTYPNAQYHVQDIEDKFRIKLNNPDISMYESISGAFFHTHSHMYIDNPNFEINFKKQMDAMVVPPQEQDLALKYLSELRKELNDNMVHCRDDKMEHCEQSYSSENVSGLADQNDMRETINK